MSEKEISTEMPDDRVPEITPEVTPEKTPLSGGEQNNGPVPG